MIMKSDQNQIPEKKLDNKHKARKIVNNGICPALHSWLVSSCYSITIVNLFLLFYYLKKEEVGTDWELTMGLMPN